MADKRGSVEEGVDPSTGRTYYYSSRTGETSWRRSQVAITIGAAVIQEKYDEATGQTYYCTSYIQTHAPPPSPPHPATPTHTPRHTPPTPPSPLLTPM